MITPVVMKLILVPLLKKLLKFSAIAGVGGYSLLVSLNLLNPVSLPFYTDKGKTSANPYAAKALPMLTQKCAACHVQKTNPPIYSVLPIAHQVVQSDIKMAQAAFEMTPVFIQKDPLPESTISLLMGVLQEGSMPPLKYTALHWNALTTPADKELLTHWLMEERRLGSLAWSKGLPRARWQEPVQPLVPVQGLNSEKVALGFKLFHDKRLSGDETLSCASCHALSTAGVDNHRVSTGINGQLGGINSPSVYNAVYHVSQFWNGRAKDLFEQAAGPVTNPIEMGGDWNEVLPKLMSDPKLLKTFMALYPQDGVTQKNIQDAIATFESTLVTTDSPFDLYLKGDDHAIDEPARAGYALFKAKGCITCHAGPLLGGTRYKKLGVKKDYFADRRADNQLIPITDADLGRFMVTHQEQDRFVQKVPSLRNVALTGPYFHDGRVDTLPEAVNKMAIYQLGISLKPDETQKIVAFLKSLTGNYQGQPLDKLQAQK
jgi:cytochrome c peroxidase